jgi:hypothetical protein
MAQCQIFYNIALKLVYKNLNDDKTKKLLLDLLEKMVKSTDNEIDDQIFEFVKHKLYSKPISS